MMRKTQVLLWATLAFYSSSLPAPAMAARDKLSLVRESIPLPGAPAKVIATDLDGDGRRDLAAVVAYTEWDQIGIEESTEMEGIEGLVEVLTVVPSLFDRRELRLFRALAEGGYESMAEPISLGLEVLSIGASPAGLLALTDRGVEILRWPEAEADGAAPAFEPLFEETPVLAGAATFLPALPWLTDLDGDEQLDILFPAPQGLRPLLWRQDQFEPRPLLELPGDEHKRLERFYPLPEVEDLDGDGLPDLLVRGRHGGLRKAHLIRGLGDGRFASPVDLLASLRESGAKESQRLARTIAFLGDLDGDGRAEFVSEEEQATPDDAGMRKEMRAAKRPKMTYRAFRMDERLAPAAKPYIQFAGEGYALDTGGGDEGDLRLPGGLQDLDGDGRLDLISLTLDFSLLQVVRVMTTMSLSLGLDFHIWCQDSEGRFHQVQGLDLSGKFRINLRNVRFGQLSQFAGDFDGDGKADFVQMGRGKTVTIHRGREGCVYPPEPDLALRLAEAPKNLALVQVRDLDGDGFSDLLVTQPEKAAEPGLTPPVRLDLYLSAQETKP